MSKNPCFPTQGELVQFTFNVFGLMPRKYDPSDEFDEKSKKSFQRLLQRLGDEEGLLLNNFEKALDTFHQLLASQIADQVSFASSHPLIKLTIDDISCLLRCLANPAS